MIQEFFSRKFRRISNESSVLIIIRTFIINNINIVTIRITIINIVIEK